MIDGWKQVRLGDVCDINKQNIKKDFPFKNITYLDISSVGSGEADYNNVIAIKDAPSRAKRIPSQFDSIIATVRPGNRTFSYLKNFPENTVVSTGFAVISPNRQLIDSRFLYYIISEPSFTGYLVSIEQGANYPAVSAKDICEAKVALPPLPTQRKIAGILSAYDDLIENNLKRIKLLEEMAQLTYEEWFVRMKFPGHETTPINEETGLPEGWEITSLVDCCKLTMGQSPRSEFYNDQAIGLPFHQGVKDYGFRFPENSSWSTAGNRTAEENSVLFSVRAPVGRLNVAIDKIILGRGLAAINHKRGWNSFLFYQLQKIFFEDNLIGGGAIFNSVTKKDVERIKLVHATEEITQKYNDFASDIDESIKSLTKQNQLLKEARDILLPRLMTGMIEV